MIIFLDFDGVLHPANVNTVDFFCRREQFESAISMHLHVSIVISSTWRQVMPLPVLKAFCSERIRHRIIGVTPTLDDEISAYWRYEEIRLWIKRNQYAGNWLAIDDAVQEFPPTCPQLIACDARRGFDASVADALLKALRRMDGQSQIHRFARIAKTCSERAGAAPSRAQILKPMIRKPLDMISIAHPSDILCYLDFDGVLHDDEVYFLPRRGVYLATPDRTLFEWAHVLEDLFMPYPEVKIVLSTSWVRMKSFYFAKSHLPIALQDRVIGATYHHRVMIESAFDQLPRGQQVWSDVLRRKALRWFAIDNDDDGWPRQCRDDLILTEDHTGVSDPIVQEQISARLAALSGWFE